MYILQCADDSYYTGIAKNVQERIDAHAAGRGARYTRGRGPLRLCAVRRCHSKSTALSLELAIKALPRSQKLRLADPETLRRFAKQWIAERKRARAAPARQKLR
ncbi:MAG: GIY-YIG nuclease family protein [Polyangiaceae bacterium]